MTDTIEIPERDWGKVHVFTLDLRADEVPAFTTPDDSGWPLKRALGATHLDPERVEVLATRELTGMGLSGYLVEGQGVQEAQVVPDRARLDALTGHVVVLPSVALGTGAQTLRPTAPLAHFATYSETPARPANERLESESARGTLTGGRTDPAPAGKGSRARLIAVIAALAVAALLLVWAFAG
ncbi:aspartate carbamoyltransferase catalytic subunit [Tranquillimonas rosea]|uniref:aspartate carbamoyltransferase catalytic subunit n=1 Tax=Tranquillimonas rosea TaxID=641238 RepID=UPI003BAB2425